MSNPLTFAQQAYQFYTSLHLPVSLPAGVKVMNPYQDPKVREYTHQFLNKYFSDQRKRIFVFGNYQIFCKLNEEGRFFKKVYALEHPRFILQYRRKKMGEYLKKYESVFRQALNGV